MDRFIVGTGRCGSTLLSRMIAENPDTLSLFEYFNGLDITNRFRAEPISGPDFAQLLAAEQPVVTAVLKRGYEVAEVTYPFGTAGRYRRDDPLPWVLVATLPRLSEDPDALFEDVMAFCRELPTRAPIDQHRALFEWLCRRFARAHWVERSGSSIDYLETLAHNFPEARFLHIYRDGYEAALSMRGHHAYRLPIALLYQAADGSGPQMSAVDFQSEPVPTDPLSKILAGEPPIAYYGRYWSDQVLRGFRALRAIDADRYLEVRFEELVAKPERELERVAAFFELAPGDWIQRAVGLVRGIPQSRFPALAEDEQAVLRDVCRPGRALLGQSL